LIFVPALIYLNIDELMNESLYLFIALGIVTLLTYMTYLRTALADPGYINSLMFNKAYANNETEVSQINLT
jgi:hypothetical protein